MEKHRPRMGGGLAYPGGVPFSEGTLGRLPWTCPRKSKNAGLRRWWVQRAQEVWMCGRGQSPSLLPTMPGAFHGKAMVGTNCLTSIPWTNPVYRQAFGRRARLGKQNEPWTLISR